MTNQERDFSFTRAVEAPPKTVYYALSTAQGWRDWLADSARFEARPGASFYLGWAEGWHAAGRVAEAEEAKRIRLSWRGLDDPAPTEVRIDLEPQDGGTNVELWHGGFGAGEDWDQAFEQARKGWERGLENLASIFATGEDLRITQQPMLGILLSDFNEKVAAELGVPVTKGVRIDRPLEGMGAERAGLQPSDVIVEMAGVPTRGFADLTVALREKRAGDVIPVAVYRGSERIEVEMELSRRPLAEVPDDPAAFAQALEGIYQEIAQELRAAFEGVGEEEAETCPRPEDWSAKEILAHLIDSEQFNVSFITEYMLDSLREFTAGDGEYRPRLQAMLAVTPTIPALLDRFELSQRETLALLSEAEPLKARKGVLWQLGQNMLQFPGAHERGHITQIRETLEAVRAG